jgi:hypothetical protein
MQGQNQNQDQRNLSCKGLFAKVHMWSFWGLQTMTHVTDMMSELKGCSRGHNTTA